jgi:hypothetical protein
MNRVYLDIVLRQDQKNRGLEVRSLRTVKKGANCSYSPVGPWSYNFTLVGLV